MKLNLKLLCFISIIFSATSSHAQIIGLPSFADLVEKLSPSVVNISTTTKEKNEDKHTALGSGFILDKEGYILTNRHVVENAQDISVILYNNTPLSAVIIGEDSKTDIALIKIDTNQNLSPVILGNSDNMRVGDWVLAIGNPFGLGGSVTAGIVSAKSRDIASGSYDDYIQTDASINQGSSGGPMFNLQGEVIGINTALFSTTGASMGIGFAIPINQAHFVIKQLKEFGKVNRSWLGLKIQPQTENNQIIISGVSENSPASLAGIEAGDVIISINGQNITTAQNFSQTIAETPIGQEVELEIKQNNLNKKITLITQALPKEDIKAQSSTDTTSINFPLLGINLQEQERSISGQNMLAGLLIDKILPNSDSANKGLQKGNILIKIDGKDVITIDNAKNYLQDAVLENNRPIELTIIDNNGNVRTVSINLLEHQ